MEENKNQIILYGDDANETIEIPEVEGFINNRKNCNISDFREKHFRDSLKKIKNKPIKENYFLDNYIANIWPRIKDFNYILKCIKDDDLDNINFNNSLFNRKQFKRLQFFDRNLKYNFFLDRLTNRYFINGINIIDIKLKQNKKFITKVNKLNRENIKIQKQIIEEIKVNKESNIEFIDIPIQDLNKKAYFDTLIKIKKLFEEEITKK